jgi:hypothetical protein
MTVAKLTQKGAVALNETQLKALPFGKAGWLRNTVTGDQFKVSYNANGQTNVWDVGRNATVPSYRGNVVQRGYQGVTAAYSIANGKVITTFDQDPVEVTVYKMGDTYYAARSNGFGYANYEIVPKAPELLHPLSKDLMPDLSQAADQAKYLHAKDQQ